MGAAPVDGRTSLVLVIAAGESVGLLEWLEALDAGDDHDLEVIVVGRGLGVSDRVVADLTADRLGWTVVLVDASETASAAATAGGFAATGTRLVFASAASRASRSTVIGLGEAADVPGGALAVPVTAVRSDLVLTAGAGFFQSAVPAPLLRGHALADAEAVGRHEIPAPLGDVVAMSTTTFREAGGLEATLPMVWACADLALRSGSTTLLCPDLVVLHHDARSLFGEAFAAGASAFARRWPFSPPRQMLTRDVVRRAGLDVVGVQNVPLSRPKRAAAMPKPDDEVVTTPRLVLASRSSLQVDEARPRLRWTIDLASPGGLKGDQWGDTHFGRSLAEALRRDGQHVAVDRRTVRHRESRDLDDVLLVLRGLDEPRPRVGVVNLEWIISHPDLVSAEEVSGFDRVYAASTSWSQERTRAWGIEIVPLLQCTDATLFRPGLAEPDSGPPVLFVGNSRGVYRSAVRGAIEGGVDLTLYGNGWDDILPEGTAAAAYVANHELGGLYASAGITLNDHWDDMRRDGFLSNRLFDAAACGARILTDPIAGVTDVLGALVREFTDASDLVRIVRQRESLYPPATQRLELAAHVVAEHSFDARARVLVDDAIELWRLRQR